ncbi:hypothetical protein RCL1_001851 [Eukaryota sp. TZLM3-RCL]
MTVFKSSFQVLLLVLVSITGLYLTHRERFSLHPPATRHAPYEQFSEGRAFEFLADLSITVGKRVAGTPDSANAFDFILKTVNSLSLSYPNATIASQLILANKTLKTTRAMPGQYAHVLTEFGSVVVCLNPQSESECNPVISFGSHLDSVTSSRGALDDGSGVVVQLEMLRAFLARNEQRTISFSFFNGEELGLLGSKAIANHPWIKPSRGFINLDSSCGKSAPAVWFISTLKGPLADCWMSSKSRSSSWLSAFFFGATDASSIHSAGTHVLDFGVLDDFRYYHTPSDDIHNLEPGQLQTYGDQVFDIANCVLDYKEDDTCHDEEPRLFLCPIRILGLSMVLSFVPLIVILLVCFVIIFVQIVVFSKISQTPVAKFLCGVNCLTGFIPFVFLIVLLNLAIFIGDSIVIRAHPHFSMVLLIISGVILSIRFKHFGDFAIGTSSFYTLILVMFVSLTSPCFAANFIFACIILTILTTIRFIILYHKFSKLESISTVQHMNALSVTERGGLYSQSNGLVENDRLISSPILEEKFNNLLFYIGAGFTLLLILTIDPFIRSFAVFIPALYAGESILTGAVIVFVSSRFFYDVVPTKKPKKNVLVVIISVVSIISLIVIISPALFNFSNQYPLPLNIATHSEIKNLGTKIDDLFEENIEFSVNKLLVTSGKYELRPVFKHLDANNLEYSRQIKSHVQGIPYDANFGLSTGIEISLDKSYEIPSIKVSIKSEQISAEERLVDLVIDHSNYFALQAQFGEEFSSNIGVKYSIVGHYDEVSSVSSQLTYLSQDSSAHPTTISLIVKENKDTCLPLRIGASGLFSNTLSEEAQSFVRSALPSNTSPYFPALYSGVVFTICV